MRFDDCALIVHERRETGDDAMDFPYKRIFATPFSTGSGHDAKNTGSFMDESSRKFDYVKEILLCLRQKRLLCTLT